MTHSKGKINYWDVDVIAFDLRSFLLVLNNEYLVQVASSLISRLGTDVLVKYNINYNISNMTNLVFFLFYTHLEELSVQLTLHSKYMYNVMIVYLCLIFFIIFNTLPLSKPRFDLYSTGNNIVSCIHVTQSLNLN